MADNPDAIPPIDSTWVLPSTPEQVYAAWVSSDTVIPPATKMDVKPVVGGHYRLTAQNETLTMHNEGRFIEVTPKAHLRYTWQWLGDEEITEIEVTFSAHENGTQLRLQHGGFLTVASRTNHDNGWNSYVAGLTAFLTAQAS